MVESVNWVLPSEPRTVIVPIPAPVTRADAHELCARVRASQARTGVDTVVCDAHALTDPDAAAVDAVLRLVFTARRLGCAFELRRPPPAFRNMLALAGLCELFGAELSGVRVVGQPEQREQAGDIEERGDPGDPAI